MSPNRNMLFDFEFTPAPKANYSNTMNLAASFHKSQSIIRESAIDIQVKSILAIDMNKGRFYWKDKDASEKGLEGESSSGDKINEIESSKISSMSELFNKQRPSTSSSRNSNTGGLLELENIDLGQSIVSKQFMLKDLNLKIVQGSLTLILGKIGSGKSSLLYS